MSIKPCDQDVFDNGQSVCLVDIPKETAENICRSLSAATGCKIDWHYIGGRVHIKALAAPVVERQPVLWFKHLIGAECKSNGQTYDVMFCPMDGYQPLYASPPVPVAVLHFVCDRIPDQNGCTFIECENSEGSSINAGEWVVRPDGLAQLVVSRPPLKLPEYKRPPPGCVITQEMAAHNACLDKFKELNQ